MKKAPSEARHRKEIKQLTISRDQWASLERNAIKKLHLSQAELAEWKGRFDKLLLRDGSCVWTYDEDHDAWDTACGQKFQFNDAGPNENRFACCPYCGKILDAVSREPEAKP